MVGADPAAELADRMMNGETRLHFCVGDPIAQVKSPEGLTRTFGERGVNAACVPAWVRAADFAAFIATAKAMLNVDGFVITVPHKFTAFAYCETTSDRASFLAAVNVMRREPDGRWTGDMTDGIALLAALRARGFDPAGGSALLVGAGGAGSAVALALAQAGINELAICDVDATRRIDLLSRLKTRYAVNTRSASSDPSGYHLIVNATPVGMAGTDTPPVDPRRIDARAFVADLITKPAVTPLLHAARERGASIVTGEDMFAPQRNILADFLLGAPVMA
jgi:shikimate dehydrogenase